MKRPVIILSVMAMIVLVITLSFPVSAGNDKGVVFEAQFLQAPESPLISPGSEVTVYNDGMMKAEFQIADCPDTDFGVYIQYHNPSERQVVFLDNCTTDSDGKGEFEYDLRDVDWTVAYIPDVGTFMGEPAFSVRKVESPNYIYPTGFMVPEP